jgi:hypothetical protein
MLTLVQARIAEVSRAFADQIRRMGSLQLEIDALRANVATLVETLNPATAE